MPPLIRPIADLLPDEFDGLSVDGGCGYGYVHGEVPHPTAMQHEALIALSRRLGRFLDDDEVRSVLCADGGHDSDH